MASSPRLKVATNLKRKVVLLPPRKLMEPTSPFTPLFAGLLGWELGSAFTTKSTEPRGEIGEHILVPQLFCSCRVWPLSCQVVLHNVAKIHVHVMDVEGQVTLHGLGKRLIVDALGTAKISCNLQHACRLLLLLYCEDLLQPATCLLLLLLLVLNCLKLFSSKAAHLKAQARGPSSGACWY